MTVSDLLKNPAFSAVSVTDPDRTVSGVYIGDLLSWVMGRAPADSAWITIMSNVNVIAVATLTDVSTVILAEGVVLDAEIIKVASEKSVNIIASSLPAYESAMIISGILK